MNEKPVKKRGRPEGYRVENPITTPVQFRATKEQVERYKAAAGKEGLSFSAWVRKWLDKGSDE